MEEGLQTNKLTDWQKAAYFDKLVELVCNFVNSTPEEPRAVDIAFLIDGITKILEDAVTEAELMEDSSTIQ